MMLSNFVGIFGNVLMIILIIFNLAIFAVSLREKKRLLTQSEKNIANINEIIHWKVEIWVLKGINYESKHEHSILKLRKSG